MYSEKPNEGEIIKEYNKFYTKNKFVKNQHTQYYKRWIRSLAEQLILTQIHLNQKSNQCNVLVLGILIKTQIVEVISRISTYVYTVEQSIQSKYSIWGTATAGAWKTTNKGDNWNLITSELPLNGVYT